MTTVSIPQHHPERVARIVFAITMSASILFIAVILFVMNTRDEKNAPHAPMGGSDVSVWALDNP